MRYGFTLIELLVVVTIIVVLLALLAPALDKAMEQAGRAVCASNQHQIGVALHQYVISNRLRLPPESSTFPNGSGGGVLNFGDPSVSQAYPNFLGSLISQFGNRRGFVCPSADATSYSPPTERSDTSYLGNGAAMGISSSRIDAASSVVFAQEFHGRTNVAHHRPASYTNGTGTIFYHWQFHNGYTVPQRYSNVHDSGGNLLFGDAHVEYRKAEELRARDFGLTDGGVTGSPNDTQADPDNKSYRSRFK